jgi:hypothetical protein
MYLLSKQYDLIRNHEFEEQVETKKVFPIFIKNLK